MACGRPCGRRDQEMKPRIAVSLSAVFLAAVLALTTAGCKVGGGAAEYRDPSVPIVVEKGEEFTIVLESNPSTGYRWQLGKELDEKVVTLQKVEFEEPEAERRGLAGEERWTFKAAGLGHAEIVLEHVPSWEKFPVEEAPEGKAEGAGFGEEPKGVKSGETGAATAPKEWSAPTSVTEGASEHAGSEEVVAPKEWSAPTSAKAGEVPEGISAETLTFSVWVKEKGARDKEPKKYKDPAEIVKLKEGYRFSVILESDPTAGRRWELAEPLDEELLSLVSVTFEAKGGSHVEGEEETGAPGEETWTFEALRPGETSVALKSREGEKSGETLVFKVEIEGVGSGESSAH